MRSSKTLSLVILVAGLALWTLAPYGGCSCNNPMGPNTGPTLTPTVTHGPTLDNFDSGNTNLLLRINGFGGADYTEYDRNGWSGASFSIVTSSAQSGSGGFHMTGTYGVEWTYANVPTTPAATPLSPGWSNLPGVVGYTNVMGMCYHAAYPFIDFQVFTSPQGNNAPGGVDLTRYGTGTGISFWAKGAGTAPNNALLVKVVQYDLAQYTALNGPNLSKPNTYHYHNKTQVITTSWAQYFMPFSSFVWGGSWATSGAVASCAPEDQPLPLPGGGTRMFNGTTVDPTQIVRIQFEPNNQGSNAASTTTAIFDISIDQVQVY